jgi:RecA-family ATPase
MLNLQAIIARYGGEISGNSAVIPSVGHSKNDRGTSIKIDPNAPDGCLVHCFNGSAEDALAVKEMLRRDGFLVPYQKGAAKAPLPDVSQLIAKHAPLDVSVDSFVPANVWEYKDANGVVLYRKVRIDKPDGSKSFLFECPDGKGGWTRGMGSRRHVPYRLPELLGSEGLLFAAEGERCADFLVHWGFNATSSKDLDKVDLSVLSGKTVVVLPDNDEVGQKCAQEASRAILEAGGKPVTVVLPDLPGKGDIIDWSGTPAKLQELVQNALTNKNLPDIKATPFRWRDASLIPERPWVLGHWLLRHTVTCLVAPGGSGKSTFVSAMALALASDQESLLDQRIWHGAQRVWVWNLEDDIEELSRSIQATAKHHGITKEMLGGRLFVDSGLEGATLCTAKETKDGVIVLEPVYEALREELLRRQIDVLIVDPFVSSHEVEENSNSKIDKVAKEWGRLAKAANCCIVLAHHTSKAGSGEVNAMSARGAVALINAARATLVINRMDPNDALQFGIDAHEVRRYINVTDDKHNRAPYAKASWYRLASVDLGNGPVALGISCPGDQVGVVEPVELKRAVADIPVDKIRAVQEVVKEGVFIRESPQAKMWVGHAIANVLGLSAREDRGKIRFLLNQWIRLGYFNAVKKTDSDTRKLVPMVEVGKIAEEEASELADAEGPEDAPLEI